MCLTTKDATIKVAKRPIVVFKKLDKDRTALVGYKYGIRQEEPPVKLGIEQIGSFHQVNEGYHSYNRFINYGGYECRYNRTNYVFIIPKGAEYVTGWYNNVDYIPNRVSTKIICAGKKYNPLTWLYVLYTFLKN